MHAGQFLHVSVLLFQVQFYTLLFTGIFHTWKHVYDMYRFLTALLISGLFHALHDYYTYSKPFWPWIVRIMPLFYSFLQKFLPSQNMHFAKAEISISCSQEEVFGNHLLGTVVTENLFHFFFFLMIFLSPWILAVVLNTHLKIYVCPLYNDTQIWNFSLLSSFHKPTCFYHMLNIILWWYCIAIVFNICVQHLKRKQKTQKKKKKVKAFRNL